MVLLEAARILGNEVRLTIVGGNPRWKTGPEVSRVFPAPSNVTFPGPIPYTKLPDRLARAHIAVAPYLGMHNTGIGLSPIKIYAYLACALPVVTSCLPGLEFIERENVGLLVPPDDPPALAQAIRRLAADHALRAEMGRRARRLAEERFDWKHRARSLDRLLREVAGVGALPSRSEGDVARGEASSSRSEADRGAGSP
jgi:glycosyltransferase involved in cell wall biosynthesis